MVTDSKSDLEFISHLPSWKLKSLPIIYLNWHRLPRSILVRAHRTLMFDMATAFSALIAIFLAGTLFASAFLSFGFSVLGFESFQETLEAEGLAFAPGVPIGLWLAVSAGSDFCARCLRNWLGKITALAIGDEAFVEYLRDT